MEPRIFDFVIIIVRRVRKVNRGNGRRSCKGTAATTMEIERDLGIHKDG